MVAAPIPKRPQNPLHTEPEAALARALHELRVSERGCAPTLSVLVSADDAFWIGRRVTLEASLRDTTPRGPTRWEPPAGLDPRNPRPLGLIDTGEGGRAALVVSDRTVLGLLELHGVRARAHAAERSEAHLARVATQLAAWVASAPDPRARFLLGPRGVCLRSRDPVCPERAELDGLLAWWAEQPPTGPRRLGLGLATAELEPLDGPEGPHLLVTLSRPTFHVIPQCQRLTMRQREIADLASHGLTIGEIAAATRRAPDTIKTHLKSVYRTLGVANRLELRDLLDER